jgi:uncharacterized protein YceH (UPF0502 family)
MYQFLSVLAIVMAATAAAWAWFRHRTDSIVSDLQSQITLLKLRVQELEQQLDALRSELTEKRFLDAEKRFPQ